MALSVMQNSQTKEMKKKKGRRRSFDFRYQKPSRFRRTGVNTGRKGEEKEGGFLLRLSFPFGLRSLEIKKKKRKKIRDTR